MYSNLNCEMVDINKVADSIEDLVSEIYVEITKKKGNYDQAGKKNNNYKNGISTYTQHKKGACEQCGSKKNLMVHHKDGNRKNNEPSNLQTLCWSCHEKKTDRK